MFGRVKSEEIISPEFAEEVSILNFKIMKKALIIGSVLQGMFHMLKKKAGM